MDEKEVAVLGRDNNYWWFRAKDEVLRYLTYKYCKTNREANLNVGAGVFDSDFAINFRGDAKKLPYKDESFEVVILADVLEHIPTRDRVKSLKEIRRVLKTNGKLIITVPAYQWLFNAHDKYLGHKLRYSKKVLVNEVTKTGYKVEDLRAWNSILFVPLAIRKLINKKGKHSDFMRLNKYLNYILYAILKSEEVIVLPFGISIIGVFEKC